MLQVEAMPIIKSVMNLHRSLIFATIWVKSQQIGNHGHNSMYDVLYDFATLILKKFLGGFMIN